MVATIHLMQHERRKHRTRKTRSVMREEETIWAKERREGGWAKFSPAEHSGVSGAVSWSAALTHGTGRGRKIGDDGHDGGMAPTPARGKKSSARRSCGMAARAAATGTRAAATRSGGTRAAGGRTGDRLGAAGRRTAGAGGGDARGRGGARGECGEGRMALRAACTLGAGEVGGSESWKTVHTARATSSSAAASARMAIAASAMEAEKWPTASP